MSKRNREKRLQSKLAGESLGWSWPDGPPEDSSLWGKKHRKPTKQVVARLGQRDGFYGGLVGAVSSGLVVAATAHLATAAGFALGFFLLFLVLFLTSSKRIRPGNWFYYGVALGAFLFLIATVLVRLL